MVVTSLADLRRLPGDARVNGLLRRSQLVVRVPGLPVSDRLRLEGTLNRYQARCGCTAGAACLLAVLVAGLAWLVRSSGTLASLGFVRDAGVLVALAFVTGLLAKLVTLQVTRWQFSAACRRFERELSFRLAPDGGIGTQAGG